MVRTEMEDGEWKRIARRLRSLCSPLGEFDAEDEVAVSD
jgi:hypothetical protein